MPELCKKKSSDVSWKFLGVSRMFQAMFKKFQGCFKVVSRKIEVCFEDISREFQAYFKEGQRLFQGDLKMFQGIGWCFKKVMRVTR